MYYLTRHFRIRVVSPRKVSRFAPINRYYIIIDEVFFDNFLVIIYLLVCKNNNNSFILVYFKYLFISCTYKKIIIIHSFWSTFVKDLKRNFSCKIYKKPHKNPGRNDSGGERDSGRNDPVPSFSNF
jgi:hypothetical protein